MSWEESCCSCSQDCTCSFRYKINACIYIMTPQQWKKLHAIVRTLHCIILKDAMLYASNENESNSVRLVQKTFLDEMTNKKWNTCRYCIRVLIFSQIKLWLQFISIYKKIESEIFPYRLAAFFENCSRTSFETIRFNYGDDGMVSSFVDFENFLSKLTWKLKPCVVGYGWLIIVCLQY